MKYENHEFEDPLRLRMEAVHERFHYLETGVVGRGVRQAPRLGRREPDRFFTQDVLARLDRPQRPRDMKMVGKWDVDGVDFGVGKEIFVRSMRALDAKLRGNAFRRGGIARRDGIDAQTARRLHGGNHVLDGDPRRTHDAPANGDRLGGHPRFKARAERPSG